MVEHEIEIINAADWIIELGPGAGRDGGLVIAQGTPADLRNDPNSVIAPFLAGQPAVKRTAQQAEAKARSPSRCRTSTTCTTSGPSSPSTR